MPECAKKIRHFNSGNSSELVTGLVLTKKAPYKRTVVYSIDLTGQFQADDVILALCDFEVTNDVGTPSMRPNVMCAHQIILAASSADTVGTEITEAAGHNVTPGMHHGQFSRVGTLVIPSTNRPFLNLVAWAASSQAQRGDELTVEQDYGRLACIIFPMD